MAAFIFLCFIAAAQDFDYGTQNRRIQDSLKNVLKTMSLVAEQEMDICARIARYYCGFDADSAAVYALKVIRLAQKSDDKSIIHHHYCELVVACCFKSDYDSARFYLDRANKLASKMNSKTAEAKTVATTAFLLAHQEKYVSAIDKYMQALPMYQKINDEAAAFEQVFVLSNLGKLNRILDNMELARQYLDMAAELCLSQKCSSGVHIREMAYIYNEYAMLYLSQNDFVKALEYALKSDSINCTPYHFVNNKCAAKTLLSKLYLRHGNYKQAKQYSDEAMQEANILNSDSRRIEIWNIVSEIYRAQQRYPESEAEALKAWRADSLNLNEVRTTTANIALANILMNKTEMAIYGLDKHSELNNQYAEHSFRVTVADMSIKYKNAKKEMITDTAEWLNILYISAAAVCLLIIISVWLVFSHKMKREEAEHQLIVARSVLDGEDRVRQDVARDLHDGLTGMVSAARVQTNEMGTMPNICKQIDKCIEEIRLITTGMMPSSLMRFGMKSALEDYCRRFPNVNFYFFGNEQRIAEKVEIAIYYCAYELVSNSIKHSGATNIDVQLIQENARVSLVVHDNGRGFNKKKVVEGSGLRNIRYRSIAYNGKFDVVTSPGAGTETNIEFNLLNSST